MDITFKCQKNLSRFQGLLSNTQDFLCHMLPDNSCNQLMLQNQKWQHPGYLTVKKKTMIPNILCILIAVPMFNYIL